MNITYRKLLIAIRVKYAAISCSRGTILLMSTYSIAQNMKGSTNVGEYLLFEEDIRLRWPVALVSQMPRAKRKSAQYSLQN